MMNPTLEQMTKQFEQLVSGPARSFAALNINHMEALVSNQVELSKNYSDLGFKQLRAALDIKSADDVQSYFQNQQTVAQELSERVKADAEKVVSLNRKYAEEAQALGQESVQAAAKASGQSK